MSELFVRIIMNCRLGTLIDRAAGTIACGVCARVDVCECVDEDRRRRSDEDISRRI